MARANIPAAPQGQGTQLDFPTWLEGLRAAINGNQNKAIQVEGVWGSAKNYATNDLVTEGDTYYLALQASLNKQPSTNPTYWRPFAVVADGDGGTGSGSAIDTVTPLTLATAGDPVPTGTNVVYVIDSSDGPFNKTMPDDDARVGQKITFIKSKTATDTNYFSIQYAEGGADTVIIDPGMTVTIQRIPGSWEVINRYPRLFVNYDLWTAPDGTIYKVTMMNGGALGSTPV